MMKKSDFKDNKNISPNNKKLNSKNIFYLNF